MIQVRHSSNRAHKAFTYNTLKRRREREKNNWTRCLSLYFVPMLRGLGIWLTLILCILSVFQNSHFTFIFSPQNILRTASLAEEISCHRLSSFARELIFHEGATVTELVYQSGYYALSFSYNQSTSILFIIYQYYFSFLYATFLAVCM